MDDDARVGRVCDSKSFCRRRGDSAFFGSPTGEPRFLFRAFSRRMLVSISAVVLRDVLYFFFFEFLPEAFLPVQAFALLHFVGRQRARGIQRNIERDDKWKKYRFSYN